MITTAEVREQHARNDGRTAYGLGEPLDANPWAEWQQEYRLWREGWYSAAQDAQEVTA